MTVLSSTRQARVRTRRRTRGHRGGDLAAAACRMGLAAALTCGSSCGGGEGERAGARGGPPPTVRLLDARASETLRRTYHEAAGRRPTLEDLRREGAWIDSVAAPLRELWRQRGERIVERLGDVTDAPWVERDVNVLFVRQPIGVVAFALPLVIDLSAFQSVPADEAEFYHGLLLWALVHELVHRLRDQPFLHEGTVGEERVTVGELRVAGSAHDWDDVVTAFVLHDVVEPEPFRRLLFNRGLQRTIGIHRLDRIEGFLERWRPTREQPLHDWLRRERSLETGVADPAAQAWLEGDLLMRGPVPSHRVRHAVDVLREDFGLTPEESAQLLSDWEGTHGAGRLGSFPYRRPDGWWEWS